MLLLLDRCVILVLVVLFAFVGTLAVNHGYVQDVWAYQITMTLLNVSLGVQSVLLWRRADPTAPRWWNNALLILNLGFVLPARAVRRSSTRANYRSNVRIHGWRRRRWCTSTWGRGAS